MLRVVHCVFAGVLSMLLPGAAMAQDPPPPGWYKTTELTSVWTGGNSAASTFGLKNDLRRLWESARFRFEAGGLRTESSTRTRSARGTASSFVVNETETSALTAESYYARARYDRSLSPRMFLFGGAGWNRNTFAGVQNRYGVIAGAGNSWVDTENTVFKTDYGFTYTFQDDVVEDPTRKDSFAGLRISAEAQRALSSTTRFTSNLLVDENLNETEDLRADWTNSIAVALSNSLALKTSLQLLFDNQPSLVLVPLQTSGGAPTGQNVATPLNELDSVFTVALVVNF